MCGFERLQRVHQRASGGPFPPHGRADSPCRWRPRLGARTGGAEGTWEQEGLWGRGPLSRGADSAGLLPAHRQPPAAPAQAQVSNFRRENEALRSGQGASLTVVKQNTDVALQNLRVVMSNAHTSIK